MNQTPSSPVIIRSEEDLLALVPCALSFTPTQSVVMLTCAGPVPLHARVDLPEDPAGIAEAAEQLVEAAVANDVSTVALVIYTGDAGLAATMVDHLQLVFLIAGIEVMVALRVADGAWFPLMPGAPHPVAGIPFDTSNHPFVAESVLAGHITHPSREALAASIAAVPDRAADAAALVLALPPESDDGATRTGWVRDVVAACVEQRRQVVGADLARLLRALTHEQVMDMLVVETPRETARAHLDFWIPVLRSAPEAYIAAPAGLVAFTAWLSGNGALAWCAVDRANAAPGAADLAELVALLLEGAVPPHDWAA